MGALYTVLTGKLTLTEAATKSLILINPATIALTLRQIDISLGAASGSEEVQFDVYRATAIGAPEGEAATPTPADEKDGPATSSALIGKPAEGGFKKEPTTALVIASYLIQPFGGLFSIPFPYGSEIRTKLAGQRIGLRYVTPASVKPACIAAVWFEE